MLVLCMHHFHLQNSKPFMVKELHKQNNKHLIYAAFEYLSASLYTMNENCQFFVHNKKDCNVCIYSRCIYMPR